MLNVISNALSVGLIIVCWWQAHQHVLREGKLRRAIAVSYGMTAVAITSASLGRIFNYGQTHSLLWIKLALLIMLALVSIRMHITDRGER